MDIAEFPFKTKPRGHQFEELKSNSHKPCWAVHWEMGTGKTKLAIDNIGILYLDGLIDGALIVAPNGVDYNWLIDELPKHLSDEVAKTSRIFRFATKSSGTKWHKAEVKWCREHVGLAFMIMSYDAFMTEEGKEAALLFLEQRKCFYGLDESTCIKTPGAKRTMRITRTAWRAKYRRTYIGNPMPKGAFDIYSQVQFLDPEFWKRHGWDSFAMFKAHFGVFEAAFGKGSAEYERLLGYRNLEELNKLVAKISSRVLKRDVLDLPPKIYQPRYFDLSPKQRGMYDELEEEFRIWVDKEKLVTANLAMVRMLRLQQISCGYLPVGEGEPIHMIEGGNPRLRLMGDLIEDDEKQAIIWSRYKLDIDLVTQLLRDDNRSFVVYDGRTSEEDRLAAKVKFQGGDVQFFVSNPAAAGRGLTLHAAHNVFYYTNSYNLDHRQQSEDRAHRDGLDHSVNYIDLLGNGTMDKKMMLNLCGKLNTSDAVLGDAPGMDIRSQLHNWLEE